MCNDKKHFVCEQYVPREGIRPSRFVDVVISDVVEFMKTTIPALLDVPLEIKPTAREKVSLAKMLVQGESQVIGHLAKMLMDAFHSWGIGINRVVRGVVMTMVSIEIVEMELSGMGTAKVKLETRKTGHEPLFDMETTLNLLGDMKDKSCVVRKCLKQFTEGDSPQKGFILLQYLLSGLLEHQEPTSSPYSNCTVATSIPLGRLLGSGAFSSVYALEEDAEIFLKTPKSRRCVKVLENEAEALKALDHMCIPKVFLEEPPHLEVLTVQLLCDKSKLPCLRLKGLVGTPASKINVENLNKGDLQHIIEGVTSALKHAHSMGWVHLDVRPSNIIVGQLSNARPRVQLIDFGCAAQTNTSLSHFRGCPPFAHSDLLCQGLEKWKPDIKHDMASLSFTIASLLAGSPSPWCGFNGCNVEPDRLTERSNIATELLRKSKNKLNKTTRTFLIESIVESLVQSPKSRHKRRRKK
jgi:molybdopterin-binding protein